MKDLRDDLDDLYNYQAEDEDAPPWFATKERFNRGSPENNSRGRLRPAPTKTKTQAQIDEELEDDMLFMEAENGLEAMLDQEEGSEMEEEAAPQSDGTGDEAAASEDVSEMEVKAEEVNEAVERSEAVEGEEVTTDVEEAAAVHWSTKG